MSTQSHVATRVFHEIDHSVNVARIVLFEYAMGSLVQLNFVKDLAKISQGFGKIILNTW